MGRPSLKHFIRPCRMGFSERGHAFENKNDSRTAPGDIGASHRIELRGLRDRADFCRNYNSTLSSAQSLFWIALAA